MDYRKLNSVTIRDQYSLPQIQDIFDQVGGSTIFSSLDLKAGYWQLAVAEDSIEKTAFRCHLGHYVPFGLAKAPAVFQRMMDKVLAGLIGRNVMVYLDDIVIYSRSEEEHVQHLELVFARLREARLRLKPTKCLFGLEDMQDMQGQNWPCLFHKRLFIERRIATYVLQYSSHCKTCPSQLCEICAHQKEVFCI